MVENSLCMQQNTNKPLRDEDTPLMRTAGTWTSPSAYPRIKITKQTRVGCQSYLEFVLTVTLKRNEYTKMYMNSSKEFLVRFTCSVILHYNLNKFRKVAFCTFSVRYLQLQFTYPVLPNIRGRFDTKFPE